VTLQLNEWGLATTPVKLPPPPTSNQTVKMTDGGSATLLPAPAGSILTLLMPPKASVATVLWNSGVKQIAQGCYDLSGPCTIVLDGNPGTIGVTWDVNLPGQPSIQPPGFSIIIPGYEVQNPPLIPPYALTPGEIQVAGSLPGTKAGGTGPGACPTSWLKDTVTGTCLPACWDGSAQKNGVCPAAPAAPSSTGTYVALGVGALVLGGAAWWYLK
jgi:hypothetical protein